MKYMNVPLFENFTPICSFLLGFKVGRYVMKMKMVIIIIIIMIIILMVMMMMMIILIITIMIRHVNYAHLCTPIKLF